MALVIKKCSVCNQAVVCEEHKKPICKDCSGQLADLYSEIRNYMRDHSDRHFTVADLAETFDVSERQIQYLLDTGHFNVVKMVLGKDPAEEQRQINDIEEEHKKRVRSFLSRRHR